MHDYTWYVTSCVHVCLRVCVYMYVCVMSMSVYVCACVCIYVYMGFPDGSDGKESACNVADPDWISGLGRSPGEENGNPLQYSCLENSMEKEAWYTIVHVISKSRTQLRN